MSNSKKAEKKKRRKEKKQQELQKKLESTESNAKLDVLKLVAEEKLETKPDVAQFLKSYVLRVKAFVKDGFEQCWPVQRRVVSKAFVKFLDGHELIWNIMSDGKIVPRVILCDGYDVETLSKYDVEMLELFLKKMQDFGFISK